jgi:hypothetical protein
MWDLALAWDLIDSAVDAVEDVEGIEEAVVVEYNII